MNVSHCTAKSLDEYPVTMRLHHIADLYDLSEWTVRRRLANHAEDIPTPFSLTPLRWRKKDVIPHYETWSVSKQRVANAQREKAKRKKLELVG